MNSVVPVFTTLSPSSLDGRSSSTAPYEHLAAMETSKERTTRLARERANRWRIENPDKAKRNKAAWYSRNKGKMRAAATARRVANPAHWQAYDKAQYVKHRSKRIAKAAVTNKRYRARMIDSRRQWNTEYRKRSPERVAVWRSRARAKRRRAPIVTSPEVGAFIRKVRRSKFVTCYYCQRPVSGRLAHIDHVNPVSVGGKHEITNLCSACPPCNLKKRAKMPSKLPFLPQSLLDL